ncbi:jmjd6-a [Symbiodinium microadriaticum]|nr:jmjd6-a [Symbiodinium microadriaticum]
MPEKRKRTWERRADECRKKHRPKLRDWARDGFGSRRSADFVALKEKYSHDSCIQRFSYNQLSVSEFIDQYEKKSIPCIIADIPREENWKAAWAWDWHKFRHLRRRYFKVGEDDDGYSVKMRLKHYLNYRKRTKDDSPLYIFDSKFESDAVGKSLLDEYSVPSFFPEDLFSLVGEKRRPPYRWFLVGPARSGTTVHIDPLGTSAWNTVLKGCKLWVLFPPGVAKRVVKGLDVIAKGEDDEAVNYFVDLIPRMRRKYPDLDMRLFLQYEGETVFVPGGWWHAVINLEDSIAVTQVGAGRGGRVLQRIISRLT